MAEIRCPPRLSRAGWRLYAGDLCVAHAGAAGLKPVRRRLGCPQPASRRWVWLVPILASRWWQPNRCTLMVAAGPAHLLAGRGGGWAPAPHQLRATGQGTGKVLRDGGCWPSTINLSTSHSAKGCYGKNALIWILRDEKWPETRRWLITGCRKWWAVWF